LLFDLANLCHRKATERSEQGAAFELEMQLLYVLGRAAERNAPSQFVNLDGVANGIVAPLDRLPSAKTGYTVCCWLKITSFLGLESALLTVIDASSAPVLELLLKISPNDFAMRALCVRTPEGECRLDDYSFSEHGE
jgi:hypothetical protein